eukprot:12894137-Alexandrium_andersonii.AAC.1
MRSAHARILAVGHHATSRTSEHSLLTPARPKANNQAPMPGCGSPALVSVAARCQPGAFVARAA